MAYTWVAFPLTSIPNFEFEARDALETWRQNAADMEVRLTAIDNEVIGLEANSIDGDKLVNNTVGGVKLEATNSAADGYYLVWNSGSGMFDWVSDSVDGSRLVDDTVTLAKLDSSNVPTDLQIMRWNDTSGQFEWVDPTAGADTFQVKWDNLDTPEFLEDKLGVNNGAPSLFINPNYRVNQREYAQDGSALGQGEYAADCWITSAITGANGVTVNADGTLIFGADADLMQVTEDLTEFDGFQVTCSVKSGTIYIKDMVLGATEVTAGSPHTWTLSTSETIGVSVFSNGVQRTISGLKLEVGAVATPYERPQPAVEKLKCYEYYYEPSVTTNLSLAPVANNKNLLIDPGFQVNQSGYAGGVIANGTHGFDIWEAYNSVTLIQVSGQEVTINGSAGNFGVSQETDELHGVPVGALLTASVEVVSGTVQFYGMDSVAAGAPVMSVGTHTFTWTKTTANGRVFGLRNPSNTDAYVFKNFKLEESAVATAYDIPNYAEEWLKVNYYYHKVAIESLYVSYPSVTLISNTTFVFSLLVPVNMRSGVAVTANNVLYYKDGYTAGQAQPGTYVADSVLECNNSLYCDFQSTMTWDFGGEFFYLTSNGSSSFIEADSRY